MVCVAVAGAGAGADADAIVDGGLGKLDSLALSAKWKQK